ncbi:MAG TPA: ATP-binding protein [Candidatus Dormibacteraeota bacterium]|jgi:two-component system sensor histidine kinase SenX3
MFRGILRGRRAGSANDSTPRGDPSLVIQTLRSNLVAREAALASVSEGVLLVDAAGRIDYANRPAVAMLGRRFASAAEIVPTELRDAVTSTGLGFRRGQTEPLERQIESEDALLEVKLLPADPQGAVLVMLRDLTRARNTDRLRRDFVANASHELKTPVASILALAGAVRAAVAAGNLDAVARFSARVEREAERLAALVVDLLELSRLEGGAPKLSEVRLDRVVEAEVDRLRPRAEQAGLKLVAVNGTPHTVLGSEAEIEHMLHNLIDNALRYTPAGGAISVAAKQVPGYVELKVADTGIGIPPPDLNRVFERFYRVDTARSRDTGGTGLGLSIVRHIVEAHGGTVEVHSVLGEGSTFTVRLPAID